VSIEDDRQRLTAADPVAVLIAEFVAGGANSLEVICPEPGTVLANGIKFIAAPNVNPEKMYSRFYTIAGRGHWLGVDVWVQKKGRSVWLHKQDHKRNARC
jgi:hypothetical protein